MTLAGRSFAVGALLWIAFFAGVLAAWVALWRMARMSGLDVLGRPVAEGMPPATGLAPLLAMWAVMMAAMMLPTLVPTLATYADLIRPGGGSRGGWIGVVSGFLVVWVVFAAAVAVAQAQAIGLEVLTPLGAVPDVAAAGALLLVAGWWQFTRAKAVCHGVCHSPLGWFLSRWRAGAWGGARMGAGLGAWCVGCCWPYMLLGFVGGTMSLAWMGLATLAMVLEKLPEVGALVVRPLGVALLAAGVATLAAGALA